MFEPDPCPRHAQRRQFIRLVGGGAVLAALPALAACGSAPIEEAARVPGDERDPRRFMLRHALLAPNPHNRQPWLADLRREGEIVLRCDGDRLLPETDPFGRQIVIGCGAFVELAVQAAAELGWRVDLQRFPDGEPPVDRLPGGAVIARMVLTRDERAPRDPLFAQARIRQTNKGPYEVDRAIPEAQWLQLGAAADRAGLLTGRITDADRRSRLRAITRASHEIESVTPRTWLESARLMRIGPREIAANRDGISIRGTVPWLLSSVGLFDRFEVPVRGTTSFDRVMDYWAPFETGSGYFWVASTGNGRLAQLETGRAYVRAQLQATALGLDMHPLSQALQEFDEVREQHRQVHELLGLKPDETRLQILARVGYGLKQRERSPRRPLDALIAV